ncbi:HAD-IC family P-type ATPase [Methanomicrobium antiquum]|uniref:HAD-IC family P-type ATPase n=1 Tax=Methanomicrobium antiquum TaxID=487686 RepID=A0AAF0JN79_9EURY|nr:HAD-IC family P-type ATPase [Methanomicrobium antiquum]WFN37300.1 HAD-IC family P-type ATPase [Methanomicrobium antiquum]
MNNKEAKKSISWHSLPIEDVYEKLATGTDGISDEEASERLKHYGKNSLPVKKPPGIIVVFLHQFKSPLIYILLAAAFVSFLLNDYKDGFFILAVVFLNAFIGMFQEWKAEKSATKLQSLLHITTTVIRDGKEQYIDAENLIPGDLVSLESGSRVPADLRLIHEANLLIDESLLTGESVGVEKKLTVLKDGESISEMKNMVFGGTTVLNGRGRGIVVATGLKTEVGIIAKSVSSEEASKPPLLIRMEKFSRDIGILVILACFLMASVMLYNGTGFTDVFFFAVALSVSAIPEGLPVAITVALSIATTRMGGKNVIVRRLAAVESLGSCTMIATDKTGTLTVNEQTVKRIILPEGDIYDVSGAGYTGFGEIYPAGEDKESFDFSSDKNRGVLQNLALTGVICNEGSLYKEGDSWIIHGDSMDVALLSFSYKAGIDPDSLLNSIVVEKTVPFEPEKRYSAVYYTDSSGQLKIAVKGAFEVISEFCSHVAVKDAKMLINKEELEYQLHSLAKDGYRVLAFAEGCIDEMPKGNPGLSDVKPDLVFQGIAGFIDPLRPGVFDAIKKCRDAGVEVSMITGDHPDTALAIGKELGIASDDSVVMTGNDLLEAGTPDLPIFIKKLKNVRIFARVNPLQKLMIVDTMVKSGHFVAVTGDGVNDAPALKKANIGVAMGSGTDVAKDTSSMIITDDDFASIVSGIEEGRYAYDNIRKVTYLLVSTGFAEIILFTLALFAGLPLPLIAVQLLWLNLVTNGIQDVFLAFEKGEPETMKRKPRDPKESVFNSLMIQESVLSGMVIGLIAFSVYFWLMSEGFDEFSARSILVLLMVLLENFHALNCRSEYHSVFGVPLKNNYYLIFGIIFAQGIHILAMMTPFMQDLLGISPVNLETWFVLLAISSLILVVMELFKFFKFRLIKSSQVYKNPVP